MGNGSVAAIPTPCRTHSLDQASGEAGTEEVTESLGICETKHDILDEHDMEVLDDMEKEAHEKAALRQARKETFVFICHKGCVKFIYNSPFVFHPPVGVLFVPAGFKC